MPPGFDRRGGTQLSATTAGLEVAKRIVVEGLAAARIVRRSKGCPLAPSFPAAQQPSSPAATVDTTTLVSFDKQAHIAYPEYHPEAPHFFGGSSGPGNAIPAGYWWQHYRALHDEDALAVTRRR